MSNFIRNATGEEVANNQKPQMSVRFKEQKYVKTKVLTRYVSTETMRDEGMKLG